MDKKPKSDLQRRNSFARTAKDLALRGQFSTVRRVMDTADGLDPSPTEKQVKAVGTAMDRFQKRCRRQGKCAHLVSRFRRWWWFRKVDYLQQHSNTLTLISQEGILL